MATKTQAAVNGGGIAALITLAVAGVVGFTTDHEGEVLYTYRDPAGIPTYCIGETENVVWDKKWTRQECRDLLSKRMAKDYAPPVLKAVPAFSNPVHINRFRASMDFAYNCGPGNFAKSPMAREFNKGNYAKGCQAFIGFCTTAKVPTKVKQPDGSIKTELVRTQLRGLVKRRQNEAALCNKTP